MRLNIRLVGLSLAAALAVWPTEAGAEVGSPERPSARPEAKRAAPGNLAGQPKSKKLKTAALQPAASKPKATPAPAAPAGPRAKPKPVTPTLHATIDLTRQRMVVKANGRTLYSWKISSGRSGHETPTGKFRPKWMAKDWYSRTYDMAPMPYAVFFNGGIATHGTSAVGRLGRPASHGCIRLQTSNARKFYNLVHRHGRARTRIVVTGRARQTRSRVARRRPRNHRGARTYRVTGPNQLRTYRVVRPHRYGGYYSGRVNPPPSRFVYPGDRPSYRYSGY